MSRLIGYWCATALLALSIPATAQNVSIHARTVIPENLTSSAGGTLYIGSYGSGGIYRAAPGAGTATLWVAPGSSVNRVMGLWADDAENMLWVCDTSSKPGDSAASSAAAGSVRRLELSSGRLIASYPMAKGGACNDLTLAKDGALYITDMAGRILRIGKGDPAMAVWREDPQLQSADGLAQLDDGQLYVNTFRTGKLLRIAINADGSAGAITELTPDRPLARLDGMRQVAADRMLVVEAEGRLTELTVAGDQVKVRTIRDGIDDPAGVTLSNGTAYVSSAGWATLRDPAADSGVFTISAIPYSPASEASK